MQPERGIWTLDDCLVQKDGELQYPYGYDDGKDWSEILLTELKVSSVSGEPTISRAVPIKLNSSDVSIDWSGVSSKADLLVQDQYGNTLDYYFESFDADSEEAVIWVYRDWVRDDSIQLQILEGRGDETSASTVFDKETDLKVGYLLNEDSGDALDVTSNNNDGTASGVTQGEDGIVDGAYSFDGNSGDIEDDDADDYINGLSAFAIEVWVKSNETNTDKGFVLGKDPDEGDDVLSMRYDKEGMGTGRNNVIKIAISTTDYEKANTESSENVQTTDWQHLIFTWSSGNNLKLYIDGSEDIGLKSVSASGELTDATKLLLGKGSYDENGSWNGEMDNFRFRTTECDDDTALALYDATKESPDFFEQV